MKSSLLASAFTAALAFGLPTAAEAHSSFKIYFGVPHYSYEVEPDYAYRAGYGWYDPEYEYDREDDYEDYNPEWRYRDRPNRNRLTCGEARRKVRDRGYRDVRTVECNGITFTFRAWRGGRPQQILVNSRTGNIWRG